VFGRIIQHAKTRGKEVVLAVGGHMHDRLKTRSQPRIRDAVRCLAGVPVLNACRVPRLERREDTIWRWDYRVEIGSTTGLRKVERVAWAVGQGIVSRQEIFVPAPGSKRDGGYIPEVASNTDEIDT
jgi:hypothetical protein